MAETDDELHRRLLTAAIDILGRDGGAGLTLRTLATAAHCSTMGVYTRFAGKPGLINAIIVDGFDSFDNAINTACDVAGPGRACLIAGAVAYRDWALDHRVQYQVMFTPYVPGFESAPATIERGAASLAAYVERVRQALVTGAVSGRPEDAPAIAHHFWASIHGHVMIDHLRSVSRDDTGARAGFIVAMNWLLDGTGIDSH